MPPLPETANSFHRNPRARVSAGASRPRGQTPVSKVKRKFISGDLVNPQALPKVGSLGGLLFDAPIL